MEGIPQITGINPLGLLFITAASIMILLVPANFIHLPITIASLYLTIGQQVEVLGVFTFTPYRILFLIGWLRLIIRGELEFPRLNAIDKTMLIWIAVHFVVNVFLLYGGDERAIVNRLGYAYDTIGIYFFYRVAIKSFEDAEKAIQIVAVLLVPLAILMAFEKITGRNIFSFFGGVPEIADYREGGYRAQGPFRSPIIGGTFGATMFPLFVGMWWKEEGGKLYAIFGVIGATIITVAGHSGGPVSVYIFAIISLVFWRFRDKIRTVLWTIFIVGVFLHLMMNAPVWYLYSRLSAFVGGTGWHRAYLIDMAIEHFDEWWLIGTKYTAHWMPYSLVINPDHADITNQFISEGIAGGLITMILYTVTVVYQFKGVHIAMEAAEALNFPMERRMFIWSIGAAMVAHILSLTSITYFDQIVAFYYMLAAMISHASDLMY